MSLPLNAPRLVMFDLDGTLVETAPEICDAVNDTLSHFALAPVAQQQVNDWIGHGTHTLLVQALAFSQGQTEAAVRASDGLADIAAVFKTHYAQRCGTRSHPYPDVVDTLARLRQRGAHLAVVTNKESAYTQTVLDAHGLTAYFDAIVCGDTLPTKKPAPEGVLSCLAQFAVAASDALFVGDSSIDVATARNAGVPVWVVPYGYNMGQQIAASAPDRIIATIGAIE
ncbi:MAG: phosphoglycolate phosphatase [Rhodoferax sp.]|nr:phosphoglycolate phosphatase [Rhodoferax sp.]